MATILIIGSGGREHCVGWKFSQSSLVSRVCVLPGNAGTRSTGKFIPSPSLDPIEACLALKPALVFVGPEQALVDGLVDKLQALGFKCFGPTRAAAELEASKAFSKEFFERYALPTAAYRTFHEAREALAYVKEVDWMTSPVVVKASGLCAGKGVFIPMDAKEAEDAVKQIMLDQKFGAEAGNQVVIEERLEGQECSVLAFCDGTTSVCMPAAQDHKRVNDGDEGPNTGGMGAYAPAPCVTPELFAEIEDIVQRTLDGLKKDGTPFVGVLFAGIMLTKKGPKLLEYNVRMGDPETEVVLPLLKSDLYEVCLACVDGKLKDTKVEWLAGRHAATVVMAANGYPDNYPKGMLITCLDDLPEQVVAFHAGTALKDNRIVSNGGRVLAVTGLGSSLREAVETAYAGVHRIQFEPKGSVHFRNDIAHRALGAAVVEIESPTKKTRKGD